MEITMQPAYQQPEAIRELLVEYTGMLLDRAPAFAGYLERQGFERELTHLREKYGTPHGRLYLVRVDGQAAGCVAMRPLDQGKCELKRLYIRPAFRGRGLARALLDAVRADLAGMGVETLYLVTDHTEFYERCGWQFVGWVHDTDGGPERMYAAHTPAPGTP